MNRDDEAAYAANQRRRRRGHRLRVITPVAPAGQSGVLYTGFTFTVDGGRAPITYAIVEGALPTGLTLNTSTGAVSGTPSTSGPFSIRVQATDPGFNHALSNAVPITIAP